MLTDNILQSDLLDLLFDNRNKAYGAYILRKNYTQRLMIAIVSVATLVLLAALLQFELKGVNNNILPPTIDSIRVLSVTLSKEEMKKPLVKKELKQIKQSPIKSTPPLIVKDSLAKDTIVKIADVNMNKIGAETVNGLPNELWLVAGSSGSGGTGLEEATKPIIPVILDIADVMPQFPRGMDAFQLFMKHNLKEPNDLEIQEQVLVKAKFIVSADGSIKGIEILQSERKDLDAEVIRVLNKMPKWIPGIQDGKNVAVYFKLPVTFVGPDE